VLPFYEGLFGWELEDVMPPEADGTYVVGRIRGGDVAGIGSIGEGAPPFAMWNTYIWVDSADDAAERARTTRARRWSTSTAP
jgi:predicted enzyme related to lactoylglutathione lyase